MHKEVVKENKDSISFFQSLSSEEQQKVLAMEINIVIEHESPERYEEVLNKIHSTFDSK